MSGLAIGGAIQPGGAAAGDLIGVFPRPRVRRLVDVPSVMASPPSFTLASGASSSIGSAVRVPANDPAFRYSGHGVADATSDYAIYGGVSGMVKASFVTDDSLISGSQCNNVVAFDSDADKVEFLIWASFLTSSYRLWVNGQPATATSTSLSWTDNSPYRLLVNFGSRAVRSIVLEIDGARALCGAFIAPTSTIWQPTKPSGPRAVVMGDSFAQNAGGTFSWDNWASEMGRRLGWDVIMDASGGTGYIAVGTGAPKVKYRDRFTADVTAQAPEIVVFSGGFNDNGQSSSAMQAEAALLFAKCAAELPNAQRLVILPHTNRGVTGAAGVDGFSDIRDGIKAAAVAAGITTIDPVAWPLPSWITGNGHVGSTASNGNADFFISSDGTHPTDAGSLYLGRRAAAAIVNGYAT